MRVSCSFAQWPIFCCVALTGTVMASFNSLSQLLSGGPWQQRLHRSLYIDYVVVREGIAEFVGTTLLLVLGIGGHAQATLSEHQASQGLNIAVIWGTAVVVAMCMSVGVSGGHLNPAISLASAVIGRLNWCKLPVYMIAQYAGSTFGAALAYALYYDALVTLDGGMGTTHGVNATANIFAIYPKGFLSTSGALGDQIAGSCILCLAFLAYTDNRNMGIPKCQLPLLMGLTVSAIGLSYGYNCGVGINPARDLGPRVFTSMAGWSWEPFTYRNGNWFWIPVVGPHIGAVLAVLIYQLAIGLHWPPVVVQTESVEYTTVSQLPPREISGHTSLEMNTSQRTSDRVEPLLKPRDHGPNKYANLSSLTTWSTHSENMMISLHFAAGALALGALYLSRANDSP